MVDYIKAANLWQAHGNSWVQLKLDRYNYNIYVQLLYPCLINGTVKYYYALLSSFVTANSLIVKFSGSNYHTLIFVYLMHVMSVIVSVI